MLGLTLLKRITGDIWQLTRYTLFKCHTFKLQQFSVKLCKCSDCKVSNFWNAVLIWSSIYCSGLLIEFNSHFKRNVSEFSEYSFGALSRLRTRTHLNFLNELTRQGDLNNSPLLRFMATSTKQRAIQPSRHPVVSGTSTGRLTTFAWQGLGKGVLVICMTFKKIILLTTKLTKYLRTCVAEKTKRQFCCVIIKMSWK